MNSLLFGNFETLGKMVGEICFKLLSSRVSDMQFVSLLTDRVTHQFRSSIEILCTRFILSQHKERRVITNSRPRITKNTSRICVEVECVSAYPMPRYLTNTDCNNVDQVYYKPLNLLQASRKKFQDTSGLQPFFNRGKKDRNSSIKKCADSIYKTITQLTKSIYSVSLKR